MDHQLKELPFECPLETNRSSVLGVVQVVPVGLQSIHVVLWDPVTNGQCCDNYCGCGMEAGSGSSTCSSVAGFWSDPDLFADPATAAGPPHASAHEEDWAWSC